jgi:hypothetical protein
LSPWFTPYGFVLVKAAPLNTCQSCQEIVAREIKSATAEICNRNVISPWWDMEIACKENIRSKGDFSRDGFSYLGAMPGSYSSQGLQGM